MRTLMVADDNRLSRELLRDLLESDDCRVIEARDGQELLDLMEGARPDLVLLDLQMPRKDGFAVLAEIRSNPRYSNVPVVLVTARAMQTDRESIAMAGFDAYLTKPVNGTELRSRVDELLRYRIGERR